MPDVKFSTWAKFAVAWVVCIAFACYGVSGQGSTQAYCFQFTWLGPTYSNESTVGNGTCDDLEFKPSVCVDPLVYTYDGSQPNLTYMWLDTDLRSRVSCRLTKGEVCAKWTFTYNNELENVTYLCTKVTVDGRSAMTNGCTMQKKAGRLIEVCACETAPSSPNSWGFPCNSAPPSLRQTAPLLLLAAIVVLTLLTR